MSELLSAGSIAAFLTLAALEIVLGIDNVVFLAILANRLPAQQRRTARLTGLSLAAFGRIALLLGITWVITLEQTTLFAPLGHEFTAKDLVLALGGLFLIAKATWEIHHSLEEHPHATADGEPGARAAGSPGFAAVIAQILVLDLVFSIDSVLTAVGMVRPEQYAARWVPLTIMAAAIVAAIGVMLIYAGALSRFIERHPTMKMLALSFLLLIGVVLVAEAFHQHIPRGYIYFAMSFSLFVELLNLRLAARRQRKREAGEA